MAKLNRLTRNPRTVIICIGLVLMDVIPFVASVIIFLNVYLDWPASRFFTSKYTTSDWKPMVGINPLKNRFTSRYSASASNARFDKRR